MIAAASAIAVAVGPLIGGAVTTFASWRWVFVGEVVIVAIILPSLRKIHNGIVATAAFDYVGAALSILGLSRHCVRRSDVGQLGLGAGQTRCPDGLGHLPVLWLVLAGILLLFCLMVWEPAA